MDFSLGKSLSDVAKTLIPGGCHTYAKGDDQYPEDAPRFITRGSGCHVWDMDGNEFIEYGMGLRSVTLGHAFPRVVDAVARQLSMGTNFTRPAPIEVECARELLSLIPAADMVKFCKNGSDALDAAVRLARAATRRDHVAICADHPFFSTSDWFIGTTAMNAGVPSTVRDLTLKFRYNDVDSLAGLFRDHPDSISCVVMEPARTDAPAAGFLGAVRDLCTRNGALLVFDEMITGFRWNLGGAQMEFGIQPDLSTWGKAMGNGFAISALAGRKDFLELGGSDHDRERVFLLSTTHGAESHALAAAIETIRVYRELDVVSALYEKGRRLRVGLEDICRDAGLEKHLMVQGRDCGLLYVTRGPDGVPSQAFRTLFLQELIQAGVLAPSFFVSYSHTDEDIDRTLGAVERAVWAYRRALEGSIDDMLRGRPSRPVFRRHC